MPDVARPRYPGAQPFSDDALSRALFNGRASETTVLAHRIIANRLTVMFARSGLGKTSLLNAGIAEHLRTECLAPLSVRVSDGAEGPLASVYRGIEGACRRQQLEFGDGDRQSLWHFFKTAEFWRNDVLLTPVLILDQFEELFTLRSPEQRSSFLDELSCLVRGVRPARESLPRPDLSDTAPVVKVMLSLREDFLAYLEEIADRIPAILDQRFRLLPLARSDAVDAIVKPAAVTHRDLANPPFDVDPLVQKMVLEFLTPRGPRFALETASHVEPFQLQLICQHLEESARQKRQKTGSQRVTITVDDVGGPSKLNRILKRFYTTQIAAIPSVFQRLKARRLCGQFLINPMGRRLRLEETEIRRLTGVKPATLRTLVDNRLLRVDQGAEGNYYELSHDSLVLPVMESWQLFFAWRAVGVLFLALGVLVTSLYTALIMAVLTDVEKHPWVVLVILPVLLVAAPIFLGHLREAWQLVRRIWKIWSSRAHISLKGFKRGKARESDRVDAVPGTDVVPLTETATASARAGDLPRSPPPLAGPSPSAPPSDPSIPAAL